MITTTIHAGHPEYYTAHREAYEAAPARERAECGTDWDHAFPALPASRRSIVIRLAIIRSTDRAILVSREHATTGGEAWLPLSQVKIEDSREIGAKARRGGAAYPVKLITIPAWLYAKIRTTI